MRAKCNGLPSMEVVLDMGKAYPEFEGLRRGGAPNIRRDETGGTVLTSSPALLAGGMQRGRAKWGRVLYFAPVSSH